MEININYGALADSIEKQLNELGFTLADGQEYISKLHHALNMCMFHLMTDVEYRACTKRLHKKVVEYIRPLEEQE